VWLFAALIFPPFFSFDPLNDVRVEMRLELFLHFIWMPALSFGAILAHCFFEGI
jgi:hypothetical protein